MWKATHVVVEKLDITCLPNKKGNTSIKLIRKLTLGKRGK